METVQLLTADGVTLEADLHVPAGARAGVVLCHPHPSYGGTRHDLVVGGLFDALTVAGLAAIRFDFRAEHDDGRGERLDVVAALDALAAALPQGRLAVAGYSFGAAVALATDDARIAAIVAVAPPLAMQPPLDRPPPVPVLVVCPRHDQFSPPGVLEPIVAGWPDAQLEVVESADHFLHGHRSDVAARATRWLAQPLSRA